MKRYALQAAVAKLGFALALKASQRHGLLARISRRLLERVLKFDFDLDERVRNDLGYTVEELERYQARSGTAATQRNQS